MMHQLLVNDDGYAPKLVCVHATRPIYDTSTSDSAVINELRRLLRAPVRSFRLIFSKGDGMTKDGPLRLTLA